MNADKEFYTDILDHTTGYDFESFVTRLLELCAFSVNHVVTTTRNNAFGSSSRADWFALTFLSAVSCVDLREDRGDQQDGIVRVFPVG